MTTYPRIDDLTATLEPEELEIVSEAVANQEADKFAKERMLAGENVTPEEKQAVYGAVKEANMQLRRRSFKGFEKLFSDWMGSVDVITTGEQKNKAAMLDPQQRHQVCYLNAITERSQPRPGGRSDAQLLPSTHGNGGCIATAPDEDADAGTSSTGSTSTSAGQTMHPPCSYSSVGPGRVRRSR